MDGRQLGCVEVHRSCFTRRCWYTSFDTSAFDGIRAGRGGTSEDQEDRGSTWNVVGNRGHENVGGVRDGRSGQLVRSCEYWGPQRRQEATEAERGEIILIGFDIENRDSGGTEIMKITIF